MRVAPGVVVTRGQVLRYAAQLAALAVAAAVAAWVANARIDDIIGERPGAMHRNPVGAWRTVNISTDLKAPHRIPFRVAAVQRLPRLTPAKETYSPMPTLQPGADFVVVTGECRCGEPSADVLTPIRSVAGPTHGQWERASLPTDEFTELPDDGAVSSTDIGEKDAAGADGVTRWREIFIVPRSSGPLLVIVNTDQIGDADGIGSEYRQETWGAR